MHTSENNCYSASYDIDGLVQERCNSGANALELCLSRTIPLIWKQNYFLQCISQWMNNHNSLCNTDWNSLNVFDESIQNQICMGNLENNVNSIKHIWITV